jgi:hypothetical protein
MDETKERLLVWSMWAVAFCVVEGVKVVGTVPGHYGRMGWLLDDSDGEASRALEKWRNGVPIVNGRALLDAHSRLMDDAKQLT